VPGEGVKVTFFGEEVEVPAGPARLALRSGAMVVPAGFPRVQPNEPKVRIISDFAITCASTGDEAKDIQTVTQAIMDAHERFIRQHPDQWYMFREMWPRTTERHAVAATSFVSEAGP